MPDALLAAHVAVGFIGLLLGPVAMLAERRPPHRSPAGLAYLCSALAVSVTALALVAGDLAAFWWLTPLAVLTAALALLGRFAPRWRGARWVRAYAHGQGGAYIALVTAALVVSLDGPAMVTAWIAPTVIGLPLIERRVRRLAADEPLTDASTPPQAPRRPAPHANEVARQLHTRMPVILPGPDEEKLWLRGELPDVVKLLTPLAADRLSVATANPGASDGSLAHMRVSTPEATDRRAWLRRATLDNGIAHVRTQLNWRTTLQEELA